MKYASLVLILFVLAMIFSCGGKKDVTLQESRSPEQLIQEGDLLFAQGNFQQALETYQRLLTFYPTSDLDIDAKLRMAKCYNKMEKYEQQMELLIQMVNENLIPERIPSIFNQIGQYYEQAALFNPQGADSMDYQTALKYYQKAIQYEDSEDKESKAEAWYRSGLVQARLGLPQKAAEAYQKVVNDYPETDFAILARLKLQNPADFSELSTLPDSIAAYKVRLGLGSVQEGEQPAEAPQETSFEEYLQKTGVTPDTTDTSAVKQ